MELNLAELKAWISANYYKFEQIAGWATAQFFRRAIHRQTSSGSVHAGLPIVLDATGKIDDSMIETEFIADTVGAMLTGNTETGITVTYQDADNTIDFELVDEYIADLVGAMVTGNTETAITVTYQDADNTIDFEVVPGSIDHGALGGLSDDDHAQYLLLAGRSGGQTITGIASTGNALRVTRDLTATSTNDSVVEIIQDHTGDDQAALTVQQDGTGDIGQFYDGATRVFQITDGGHVTTGTTAVGQNLVGTFDLGLPDHKFFQIDSSTGQRVTVRGGTYAAFDFIHTAAAANVKWFNMQNDTGVWRFQGINDAVNVFTQFLAGDLATGYVGMGITSSFGAKLHVLQATLGNAVLLLRSTSTNDDPTRIVYQNRVATTDATVTTLHTFTIAATTTYYIEVVVTARRTGGTAGTAEDGATYKLRAGVKNVAGTATLIGGAITVVYANEDQAAWDATIDVTGATARVRVTGAANNNITWHMTAEVDYVSS